MSYLNYREHTLKWAWLIIPKVDGQTYVVNAKVIFGIFIIILVWSFSLSRMENGLVMAPGLCTTLASFWSGVSLLSKSLLEVLIWVRMLLSLLSIGLISSFLPLAMPWISLLSYCHKLERWHHHLCLNLHLGWF